MASIEDIDDDFIICSVCNNEYDENERFPKLLPCLHTLCSECVDSSVRGTLVRCGVCQEDHKLSQDLQILPDSTMHNMMDLIKIQRKPSVILCSDCPDRNNGVDFCKDCHVFLCAECTSAHKRTQITRKHVVIPLQDLKQSGIGCFTRKEMCSVPGHEDQPFAFFCDGKDCQKPICTPCAVTDHSQVDGHAIKNLKDVYEENKRLVEQMVGELLKKISCVSSSTKQLENDCARVDEQNVETNKQIDLLFASIQALLEARKNNLKQHVDNLCINKKQSVSEQLQRLQKIKYSMENTCNYSSRMVVFTNKAEFLQLKDAVMSKLGAYIDTDIDISESESMSLSFVPGVDIAQFKDFVDNIGAVEANIDTESTLTKSEMSFNHIGNGIPSKPYPGLPRHPPGKQNSPFQAYKRLNSPKPVVEPLKLSSVHADKTPTRSYNVEHKQVTSKSPNKVISPGEKDNVLGRPMSLKSPVITPSRQPTSLGEFLKSQEMPEPDVLANHVQKYKSPSPVSPSPKFINSAQPEKIPASSNDGVAKPGGLNGGIFNTSYNSKSSSSRPTPDTAETKTANKVEQPTVTESSSKSNSPRQTPDDEETKTANKNEQPALTESSYPVAKQSQSPVRQLPSDKPIVFGDVTCPEFQMDTTSAHHEREVTADGKTLRNKKTDIFSTGSTIDLENSLVQYKGAIGTCPFKDPGKFYYEVDVMYSIQQPLEETWLVFEIGLCRLDDVDMHHTVERHEHARSFYVARYPEDGKLTQEFWHNRDLLGFIPLSENNPGLEVRVTYGLLVDTKRKKWIIVDCNSNKVIHTFDKLDLSEALYPVFGCYNPDLVSVELTLRTGNEITIIPQCIKPGYKSP